MLVSGERLFNTLQMNINWIGRKLLMSFSSGTSSKAIKRKKLFVNVAVLNTIKYVTGSREVVQCAYYRLEEEFNQN